MTSSAITYDPLAEAQELREQLASDRRRLALLLGAGTSQSVGLEGIAQLTANISSDLNATQTEAYDRLLNTGRPRTVEDVLSAVRLCRELAEEDPTAEALGLKAETAAELDREICNAIRKRVDIEPPKGLDPFITLASWLSSVDRIAPAELFTTNYDVLIERALERLEIPYFDGFVGSVEPFFLPACVEAEFGKKDESIYPPRSWVRLWKLHGSINWKLIAAAHKTQRIIRSSQSRPEPQDELMIFPSRTKYSDSKKLPFVTYQDRFSRVLGSGEVMLVVLGFSFGDDHLNDMIFRALRHNNRLAVTVLRYAPLEGATDVLPEMASELRNLTVYGPDQAIIGGVRGSWGKPSKEAPKERGSWEFWNSEQNKFTLGDFQAFAEYLRSFVGVRSPVAEAPTTQVAKA
ncbi:MAG TPA: SIR2 family protein [Bryobacteraceae bacterium]|nr:SIR2 family protein [Bryobacteraceae bacterium]